MDPICSNLGLCKRAGALLLGFDAVREAILGKKAKLVLLTQDCSEKTKKEIRFFADKNKIDVLTLCACMEDMQAILRKTTAVMAVIDQNMANMISARLK